MHTIKITPNLLLEYQYTSGKFIRLPNLIESKKIDSVARIESNRIDTFFARIEMRGAVNPGPATAVATFPAPNFRISIAPRPRLALVSLVYPREKGGAVVRTCRRVAPRRRRNDSAPGPRFGHLRFGAVDGAATQRMLLKIIS